MTNAAVELVVAVSENDVIGRANQLPWRLPADLRHFKSLDHGASHSDGPQDLRVDRQGIAGPDQLGLEPLERFRARRIAAWCARCRRANSAAAAKRL